MPFIPPSSPSLFGRVKKTGDTMTGALTIMASGSGLIVNNNALVGGYLRVGSTSAPANTTAGDITGVRLAIGSDVAFSNGTGLIAKIGGTIVSSASGSKAMIMVVNTITPTTNSAAEHRALYFQNLWNPETGITENILQGGYFENRIRGDGAVAESRAIVAFGTVVDSSSAATATVTLSQAFDARCFNRPSGSTACAITTAVAYDATDAVTSGGVSCVITNLISLRVGNASSSTVTNQYGVDMASLGRGTAINIGARIAQPGLLNGQAASTESIGIKIPTASVTFGNTAGITTDVHGVYIGQITYTSTTNARTMTNLTSLYIAGAPVASTNVTATNGPYAAWVDAGDVRLDGNLVVGSATAAALIHATQASLGSEVLRLESVATNDDPNFIYMQGRAATTDATETTLQSVTLDDNTVYTFWSHIVARQTGGTAGTTGNGALYVRVFAAKRVSAGTATAIGTVGVIRTNEDDAGWNVNLDVSGNDVRVRVTGAADQNITWHGTLIIQKVSS